MLRPGGIAIFQVSHDRQPELAANLDATGFETEILRSADLDPAVIARHGLIAAEETFFAANDHRDLERSPGALERRTQRDPRSARPRRLVFSRNASRPSSPFTPTRGQSSGSPRRVPSLVQPAKAGLAAAARTRASVSP